MKILYIVDGINYLGGANVATAALVSELLKRGVEIDGNSCAALFRIIPK